MDVIGNNIANVNTTGFKLGRVNFQDMISQTLAGAARPTDELGGVNPQQVGLGMMVASIDTIHTQGSFQTTGVMTDLAIAGDGFFILNAGNQQYYTRAGAFALDEDGLLVNPANGMKVQGWMAETVEGRTLINNAADVGDLIIPVGSKDPAAATTEVNLACNLDKRTTPIAPDAGAADIAAGTWTLDKDIYDTFGNLHTLRIEFTKSQDPAAPNSWVGTVTVDGELEEATNVSVDVGEANVADNNTFTINFSNLGVLESAVDSLGDAAAEGLLQLQVGFDVLGATPGPAGEPVRQEFSINLGEVGAAVNAVTQFAERSSTKAVEQNGYTMGYMESFKIDQNGVITGVYSNGSNRYLGQVALASFTNAGGLDKAGENTYVESNNSGTANIGPVGVAGKGKIRPGTLEMSNVDLAAQFTDMIVTQRGFQANSRTIQTADTLLQELLTLKR
jgi:flagellar hook protein FlgE